jgi:ATP-binding cassette subfamily B protein
VIDAANVAFSYERGTRAVLRACTFRIDRGDRVLLEAPSGGGKSTLASLLAGLRTPSSGVLLLRGLDLPTLGAEEWRRRAAAAPQFHENHVFSETLSFNLLMGRGWPPRRADVDEAEQVCCELGLGPLLARMPARMLQMIGEAGWQLSHGEKSRLYVARALLQNAELVILDESFAALDPANFARCLETVTRRAKSLLLIAHV